VIEKVYVVMGSSGEYSAREEWSVVAYADEELAKAHVLAAERHARAQAEAHEDIEYDFDSDDWKCTPDAMHPWDTEFEPEFESWGNLRHIRYWYAEVALSAALPDEQQENVDATEA
jgi:hypothetical protein